MRIYISFKKSLLNYFYSFSLSGRKALWVIAVSDAMILLDGCDSIVAGAEFDAFCYLAVYL